MSSAAFALATLVLVADAQRTDPDAGLEAEVDAGNSQAVDVAAQQGRPEPRYATEVRADRSPVGPVGSSAAVITRDDIQSLPGGEAQPLSSIVTATQPGLVQDVFGIGPMHVRANQGGVLYILDGVPLPQSLLFQFADVLPTPLVESVRVLTGGLPVEYGDQLGGVVEVTTRRGTGDPEGAAQVAYGTYQLIEPMAYYAQTFGSLDVFAEGTFQSTDRGLDPPSVTPILHDQRRSGNAFGRVDQRLSPRDRLELLVEYEQNDFQIPIDPALLPLSAGPPGATRGPDIYGNSPPVFVPYDSNPTENEADLFAALAYTHTFAAASLQVSPYVRSSSTTLLCDPVHSLGATADPGSTCSNVDRQLLHEGATATYSWATARAGTWKAGLQMDDAQSVLGYTQFTRLDSSPEGGINPALTISGSDRSQIFLGGAFIEDELSLGPVKLLPGLRYDLQNSTFPASSQPGLFLSGPSARLGVSYAIAGDLLLHAFVGYLWQPPSTLDGALAARILVPSLAGQAIANDLKAETDGYGELGLTERFFHRLTTALTVWGRYATDPIDVQNVGATNLEVNYNYAHGRATGVEGSFTAVVRPYISGFGNATWEVGQGQGINSERYLFTPAELADDGWQILDHVQRWTINCGADVHDAQGATHASLLFQYGSGLRTGPDNDETVPGHETWNITLRHRFDVMLHPEAAIDVLNLFNEAYPIRIGNGLFDSAYGPLRQVDVRITVPLHG